LVILSREEQGPGGLPPIGTRAAILGALREFNTAPERDSDDLLYGPGIRIELPPGDPVSQMLLTVIEEEIAWQVIMRIARALQWKLYQPSTGRELCP
jgi:hypothetical protein